MASRKTQFVKFDVQFVVEFDDKEPFDSIPVGPPDIHGFIAAGMNAIGVDKGNIIGGSKFKMNLHWPKGPVVRAERPKKGRRRP